MSTVEVLLIVLTVAAILAGLFIAYAVKQAGETIGNAIDQHRRQVGADAAFIKGVVVDASAAAKGLNRDIPAGLTRLGIAADKIANDQPAQQQAEKYKDMSEKLILGISTVLNQEITHPEGMKDDVIIGRNQGADLVKEQLQDELIKAQQ